jgi:RNA polymerase sigma-70 factor (ECF subfamily)
LIHEPGFCELLRISPPFGLKVNKQQSISNNAIETPEKWVDLYGNYLYRYALYRVYEATVAEDLVQETFLAALRSFKNFQSRSSIKTWLTGILKHKIIDHFRKKAKKQPIDDIEPNINKLDDLFDQNGHWKIEPAKWNADPQKLYDQKEFIKLLHKCLSELPGRQASAFILREIVGENTQEICKILDISTTNSWVLLHRARMYLRGCLEINWFTNPEDRE